MHFVEFPNLGLHFEMERQLFSVGPFAIQWYGLITALAFLVIVLGALKEGPKYGLSRDDLMDMMLITTPIGILGARVFYVIVNWGYYAANPAEIYKTWHGGLAIYGGIVFGIITIYLFCRHRKISALKLLDHLVVYLVLGQVIGRWGNFVNQELFGPNTTLPWGMTGDIIQNTIRMEGYVGVDPTQPVHPLFLYESLWNLAAFFVLLWFRKRKKLEGEVFSLYMISYGGARFLIDSLRFDLMVGSVNINRLVGMLFVILFAILLMVRRIRHKNMKAEKTAYQPSQYREILDGIQGESSDPESPEIDVKPAEEAMNGETDTVEGEPTAEQADTVEGEPIAEETDAVEAGITQPEKHSEGAQEADRGDEGERRPPDDGVKDQRKSRPDEGVEKEE